MKAYGGSGGTAPPFLTSALDGGERSASRPSALSPVLQSRSGRCGSSADAYFKLVSGLAYSSALKMKATFSF
jgi:hypothetical protein